MREEFCKICPRHDSEKGIECREMRSIHKPRIVCAGAGGLRFVEVATDPDNVQSRCTIKANGGVPGNRLDFFGRVEEFLAKHLRGRSEAWKGVEGASAEVR